MKNTFPLLLSFFFISTSIFGQNLIKNGFFKEGIQHWEVLLSNKENPIKAHIIEHSNDYNTYGLADNYINTNFIELDSESSLQQKVALNLSENYLLSFAYSHRPNSGDKQLIILIDDKVVFTKKIKNEEKPGKFQYEEVSFIALNSSSKISFYAVSLSGADDQGVLLTDILCEQVKGLEMNHSTIKF